jgi:hypothetical protein
MLSDRASPLEVGPVLLTGRVADAIVGAIRKQNAGARITLRGSYVRVAVPRRCEVSADLIEELLGEPFRLLNDLEAVMPSFRGRLFLSDRLASWESTPVPPSPKDPE